MKLFPHAACWSAQLTATLETARGAANKAATQSTSVASGKETNGRYFPTQVLVRFDQNMRALYHTHVQT